MTFGVPPTSVSILPAGKPKAPKSLNLETQQCVKTEPDVKSPTGSGVHLSLSGAAGLPSFMSWMPLQSKPPCQIAWFTEPVAAPGQRIMLLTPFQADRLPEKVQSPSAGLAQLIPGAQTQTGRRQGG